MGTKKTTNIATALSGLSPRKCHEGLDGNLLDNCKAMYDGRPYSTPATLERKAKNPSMENDV